MADHKFVYTVSGVDLSDEQKAVISREIGAAVSRVLVGGSPQVKSEFLSYCRINGGIWVDPNLVPPRETVGEFTNNATRATEM